VTGLPLGGPGDNGLDGWRAAAAGEAILAGNTAAWRLTWRGFTPRVRSAAIPHASVMPLPALALGPSEEAAALAARIAEDPACPLPLSEAAASLGLGARALQRRLAAQGLSLTGVQRAAQLRAACAMLAANEAPLPAIGFACGFSDQAHFTRIFRQRVGMTPGDYRAVLRAG
jgi:AraC-like DNA-binding protein